MSVNLESFEICAKIPENIKTKIKCFYIFNESKISNVLYVTIDDKVFGFGANINGVLGLGHNRAVNTPTIIQELCNKYIIEFFNGMNFVIALNYENELYGWGWNRAGQLGRGFRNIDNEYFKPEKVFFNKLIKQISCGSFHTLILTNMGAIYGWGSNRSGQIGCQNEECIAEPKLIEYFSKILIKFILCSDCQSFVLTNDLLVYSFGYNIHNLLGYELAKNENVFIPKLIESLNNIKTICVFTYNSYFLTNDGFIYFCGEINENNYQIIPKLLETELKFEDLISKTMQLSDNKYKDIAIAVKDNSIFQLSFDNISKTDFKNIDEYYAKQRNITLKTTTLLEDTYNYVSMVSCELDLTSIEQKKTIFNKFENFTQLSENTLKQIKYFYVFNEKNISNVFYITFDDKCYGFGSNINGVLGFGHYFVVEKPLIIEELCNKNIIEFHNGFDFVIALNTENELYCCGRNDTGQLGIGYRKGLCDYFKPIKNLLNNEQPVKQISCGSSHSLVLTNTGAIYGWGWNKFGQIGCQYKTFILTPELIEYFSDIKIKYIFCSNESSFVITTDGLVYSFGQNKDHILGHELDENESIFIPKLIDGLNNIKSICVHTYNAYFLTNDGILYFC